MVGAAWRLFFINLTAVGSALMIPIFGWAALVILVPLLPVTLLYALVVTAVAAIFGYRDGIPSKSDVLPPQVDEQEREEIKQHFKDTRSGWSI